MLVSAGDHVCGDAYAVTRMQLQPISSIQVAWQDGSVAPDHVSDSVLQSGENKNQSQCMT